MDHQNHPFAHLLTSFSANGVEFKFFDIQKLSPAFARLPYSIRVLLESAVRNCDKLAIKEDDVQKILDWEKNNSDPLGVEVPFRPARVILQDFTGVPAVVDLAAMRDAVKGMNKNHELVNPICPTDLVIDHSIAVDHFGKEESLQKNQALEFERNHERFTFLKWGAKAFENMVIVPPGSGIVHQVNLEYLARVVFQCEKSRFLYPDSLVGTDSHTTMINGLGVLGWGVGGIEAEAVMMSQPMSMVLPPVIGCELTGELNQFVTSTDLVLTITNQLRAAGVVGKFVEFFGSGVAKLSIADRATISNMCPEYGATCAYFPVDNATLNYLRQTNRGEERVASMGEYLKAAGLFRNYADPNEDPKFSQVLTLDLSTIESCMSGPKRPEDRVSLRDMKTDFLSCLERKVGFKGYGIPSDRLSTTVPFIHEGTEYAIRHGSVLIAAITSCTNTSNPSVMLGAGLLAKRAIEAGLSVAPYIKTSLSPGSGVVTYYLRESGVLPYLIQLGFSITGYGCMTCIGNSGPLYDSVGEAVEKGDLVCAGVLSGNRNFEGRIHPLLRANYLASPLLVIAYALAGRVDIDFETEPIQHGLNGPVFLRDLWPMRSEIESVVSTHVVPSMFEEVYRNITTGNEGWRNLKAPEGLLYPWDSKSTYIKNPPFFEGMTMEIGNVKGIVGGRLLLFLGDSVTTDHISPAGSISRNSPAARYLADRGVSVKEFNSYGSRRGNDAVMARGTFANIRLLNKLMGKPGPRTIHFPSSDEMDIFDAAERYRNEGVALVVIAGKNYGSGSSRDWAAKGPYLLGVRAIIAESYERIHRSNLVGMGILPLQFLEGQTPDSIQLKGTETFDIPITEDLKPKQTITVTTSSGISFTTVARIDTEVELAYYKNGGILPYMVRKIVENN